MGCGELVMKRESWCSDHTRKILVTACCFILGCNETNNHQTKQPITTIIADNDPIRFNIRLEVEALRVRHGVGRGGKQMGGKLRSRRLHAKLETANLSSPILCHPLWKRRDAWSQRSWDPETESHLCERRADLQWRACRGCEMLA